MHILYFSLHIFPPCFSSNFSIFPCFYRSVIVAENDISGLLSIYLFLLLSSLYILFTYYLLSTYSYLHMLFLTFLLIFSIYVFLTFSFHFSFYFPLFFCSFYRGATVAESNISAKDAWEKALQKSSEILVLLGSKLKRCRAVFNR